MFICSILIFGLDNANGQQPQLASYHEIAQILVDDKIQNQTTAFIALSSTSPLEMRVPASLDEKIHNSNITSIAITNANSCVLGVVNQACVLINVIQPSLLESGNITEIQANAKVIGDALIDDINKDFALNAEFNSVYVNSNGELSNTLGTSGAVQGNRTISVVYTMSKSDSKYLFDGLAAILLPDQIKENGGFLSAAQKMSNNPNSTVTFAIIPEKNISIYQLQVANRVPIKNQISTVNALDLLGLDNLNRSSYFNSGFYPLNSILQVTILSNKAISIGSHGGDLIPTDVKNGQKFPTDLTKAGWLFDPSSGSHISAVYLFGKTFSVTKDDLMLTIENATTNVDISNQPPPSLPNSTTDSWYVIIGILVAAGVAIYIFLRKR